MGRLSKNWVISLTDSGEKRLTTSKWKGFFQVPYSMSKSMICVSGLCSLIEMILGFSFRKMVSILFSICLMSRKTNWLPNSKVRRLSWKPNSSRRELFSKNGNKIANSCRRSIKICKRLSVRRLRIASILRSVSKIWRIKSKVSSKINKQPMQKSNR